MASVPLPRVLTQRGKTSLEIERENFEREQNASASKAINQQEVPAKEKHVRILIIGTHKEQGAGLFWSIVSKLPLQGHPIVAWKFCHVLHKILREGHQNSIKDSSRWVGMLKELGKLWGHLKEGYGRLIACYTKLLVQKMAFHLKNTDFPGNLNLGDEEDEDKLEKITGQDVNSYFELAVDMLDYMDDVLNLQASVFGSLDMSRSNSMTASGQCRLAPLISCIQDSVKLYDFIVRILFKMHGCLPPDTLGGHRSRFYEQYKKLKQFYHSSANLQYFKHLIVVPTLPDSPPNFLRAADLSHHKAPVAVVPDPEPEPDEEAMIDLLIDTSSTASAQDDQLRLAEVFHQNGAAPPSPPRPDERDQLIERLRWEIQELKRELGHMRAENQMVAESLQNRIKELEMELNEMRNIAESTQQENEILKTSLQDGEKNVEAQTRLDTMEKVAKSNEEKFKKMKEIYGKLREEHVQLLRKEADVRKQLTKEKLVKDELQTKTQAIEQELNEIKEERNTMEASMVQSTEDVSAQLAEANAAQQRIVQDKMELEGKVQQIEDSKTELQNALDKCQADIEALKKDLEQSQADKVDVEQTSNTKFKEQQLKMLGVAVSEGEAIIRDALSQADNPHHSTITVTAEYLLDRAQPVLESLTSLKSSCEKYQNSPDALEGVISSVCDFSHRLGDTIVLGFATAHSAPIEQGETLTNDVRASGEESLRLLGLLREEQWSEAPGRADRVSQLIERIMSHAEELVPKIEDIKAEQMGDMIDQEMQGTQNAIEAAAKRIAEMLESSRAAHSGIQLEVNERILDSCNALMVAIRVLVEKSKSLQREIAETGRGAGSNKEFYKKHHRWTEGLISAAKAVGWGANVLVEAADKVVKGDGKVEELVVCSQEIAASTTQLVVSSKVKAPKESANLRSLGEASKGVSEAVGSVMASAKSAAQMIEDLDTLDFSHMTLHQAKRMEMESQVRVLELESGLEKERRRLAGLRKTHYQLAGESEGWEQEDIDATQA